MFVQNDMFIPNGGKPLEHCHVINFHNFTEYIIKLTQDDTLYPSCSNSLFQNGHLSCKSNAK